MFYIIMAQTFFALALLIGVPAQADKTKSEADVCINCEKAKAPGPLGMLSREFKDRIQIGKYVDPISKIENPLTEIVEVVYDDGKGNIFSGTGTFLPECRIFASLHVLLSMDSGYKKVTLNPGDSLVGHEFDFETKYIPELGQKKPGKFVVLGHGNPTSASELYSSEEDWAVGYDMECLGEKYKMGFVSIFGGQQYETMETERYLAAGYTDVGVGEGSSGQSQFYIDGNCGVVEGAKHFDDSYIITDCSQGPGSSGEFLLTIGTENGKVIPSQIHGRPQLFGEGFVIGYDRQYKTIDGRPATGVAPFTLDLYDRMEKFLTGEPKIKGVPVEEFLKNKHKNTN